MSTLTVFVICTDTLNNRSAPPYFRNSNCLNGELERTEIVTGRMVAIEISLNYIFFHTCMGAGPLFTRPGVLKMAIKLKRKHITQVLVLMSCIGLAPGISNALTVKIVNNSGEQSYMRFGPGQTPTGTINGAAIDRNKNYSVATGATLTFDLTEFIAGKLLFSRNNPFSSSNPQFNLGQGPDAKIRWDKIELSLHNDSTSISVANLSSADFYGMGLKIDSYHGSQLTKTLTWNESSTAVTAKLVKLTNSDDAVVIKTKQGDILRVISPSTIPATAIGSYPPIQPYIDAMVNAKETVHIEGHYFGNKKTHPNDPVYQPQDYDFMASFDPNGNLVMKSTKPSAVTIVIKAGDLAKGLVSTNPVYTVKGVSGTIGENNVYSSVVRDIVAGYNFGFVGSTAINPKTGQAYRDGSTKDWYFPPVPEAKAFSYAQPDNEYYNQYASVIASVSDSYGFPFSDLLGKTFVDLNPSRTSNITITILSDTLSSDTDAPSPVPLPAGALLLLTGLAGIGAVRRKKRS